jgi:GDP-L-fucose synthase
MICSKRATLKRLLLNEYSYGRSQTSKDECYSFGVKTLVAGSSGMVGSAVARAFLESGHHVITASRREVDFLDWQATFKFVNHVKPQTLIIAAAKVGGINANQTKPVDFLETNLRIQENIISASFKAQIPRLIFLGSSCIYPRDCPQPIKEEYLLTGPLEKTNSGYALAKIVGIELIKSYREQYGVDWISLMPSNLYGPGDNYNLAESHVFPALIRRFIEAAESNLETVKLWGSGRPYREFLHVDDLAKAVLLTSEKYNSGMHLNVGSGEDLPVSELAKKIAASVGFKGAIEWDLSKPDGTPRKVLDISRIQSIGWKPQISLEQGIRSTVAWYKAAILKGLVRI